MTTTGEKLIQALQPYSIKQERGGRYRLNSPLRPGSNSHGFTLRIDPDGEHGAYYDHVSGEKGSLYQLAERLNIEVPRQPATETKRAYSGLEDYAQAHGISVDILRAAGWGEKIIYQERPALPFPTASGQRWRFIDGEKPYYKSVLDYKPCWYGLQRAIKLAIEHEQPLVICNGEISTIVAQHHGIAACAVTSGEKEIPAYLLSELQAAWSKEIIIALDCDATGRDIAQKISNQLPTAEIIDLGFADGGDLADFCKLYGAEARVKLQQQRLVFMPEEVELKDLYRAIRDLIALRKDEERRADLTEARLLDIAQAEIDRQRQRIEPEATVSFNDLVRSNHARLMERRKNPDPVQGLRGGIPGLDRLVGGFVGGRVYMLYGDTNMGKSTLACTLTSEFIQQGPGLIATTESQPFMWLDKLVAALCRVPYDLIETGLLSDDQYNAVIGAYADLETMRCHILDAGSPSPALLGAALRKGIAEHGYRWVVIDSISKMKIPGIHDIYDTTRLVADAIQDLARETQLPFLVTCQIGRNMKDRANKMPMAWDALGAGTVEQNADVILSLYNHSHYVKLGVADPNPNFPDGAALVRVIKHRWKGALNKAVWLTFVGGSRFYECDTRMIDLGTLWGE